MPKTLIKHCYIPKDEYKTFCLTEEEVGLTIMAAFGKELLQFQYQLHKASLLHKFV